MDYFCRLNSSSEAAHRIYSPPYLPKCAGIIDRLFHSNHYCIKAVAKKYLQKSHLRKQRDCIGTITSREQRWIYLSHRTGRKTDRHGTKRKMLGRRQGVSETAEKGKWCLRGVWKPCDRGLLIGWWSWGGLRAIDQRDLQGFSPSSVEAVCQPLPLQTLLPLPSAPCDYSYMTDYRPWKDPPNPPTPQTLL